MGNVITHALPAERGEMLLSKVAEGDVLAAQQVQFCGDLRTRTCEVHRWPVPNSAIPIRGSLSDDDCWSNWF